MSLPRLSFVVMRYIRDNRPTEAELLEYLGGESSWQALCSCSNLRKSGMAVLREGRWELSPDHLSADGKCFQWEHQTFYLDDDQIAYIMSSKK